MTNVVNLALTKAMMKRELDDRVNEFRKLEGPQGPAGPKGADGKDGLDGKDGKDGLDGLDGKVGKAGEVGPQGPKGDPGQTIRGPKGLTGRGGPRGVQGPKGDRGDKGEDGRSISRISISEDSRLLVMYDDGTIDSVGRVQVNVENNYSGGQGMPPGHFAIYDAEFQPNNDLVLICNNGKRINAGKPNIAAGSYTWADYVNGPSEEPTLNTTLPTGPVYNYVYGATTLYRHIPDANPYDDTFYNNFDGVTLSGAVISRSITI